MTAKVLEGMARIFKNYTSDRAPKDAILLHRKEVLRMENTRKSTYVWSPMEWACGKPVIRWKDEWRLEDYE